MSSVDDLSAFLRAQWDADEAAAQAVLGVNVVAAMKRGKEPPRWVPSPEGDAAIWDTNGIPQVKSVWARPRDHILRHDPARVLADVEAKRRILDEHTIEQSYGIGPEMTRVKIDVCSTCRNKHGIPCITVRLLALPYADHPDYREEWRPNHG